MNYRKFGRTGWKVSEIGFGAWAIGADWGHVSEEDAINALHTAIESGVNLIDTADVYGDGRSEKLISKVIKEHSKKVYVLTKVGRRLDPHVAEGYNRENLTAYIERSLRNLDVETLDLVQLHCPPTQVYYMPETVDVLDDLKRQGKIKFYGVSVEKVEEAIKAVEFTNVQSVQIIFNILRTRPTESFFQLAIEKEVGILARVPLASGLLSGKMTPQSTFSEDDHRNYNRYGESFDVGETFSGVDFDTGLEVVEMIRPMIPEGMTMAQFALRWTLMFEAVSSVIPGAKNVQQAVDNTLASNFPPINDEVMKELQEIYNKYVKDQVHQRW